MMRIDIDEAEMVRLFLAGMNQRQLAERYGCSQSLIQRRIHAHRIEGWPTQTGAQVEVSESVNANEDMPWQSRGLCNDYDSELWYLDMTAAVAKSVCRTCAHRLTCLEDALANRDVHGVRGALTGDERRRLLKRRDEAAA